jgi:hypothetical protein
MIRPLSVTNASERSLVFVAVAALSLASAACGVRRATPGLGTTGESVVYGQPSSREWVDRERAPAELARAAALIPLVAYADEDRAPTLAELYPELCPESPWLDQPSSSVCTGVLLGGAWAATARHCFDGLACEDYAVVRNHALDTRGRLAPAPPDAVFRCQRVLSERRGPESDVVVFELDRDAEVDAIRVLAPASIAAGAPLFIAGYPLGTPLKVDEDAWLLSAEPPRIWADAFAGQSGAPVVDEAGAFLGVLTGGARDLELDPRGCYRVRELTEVDEAGGEHVETLRDVLCDACREEPDAVACRSLTEDACRSDSGVIATTGSAPGCMLARGKSPGLLGWPHWLLVFLCACVRRIRRFAARSRIHRGDHLERVSLRSARGNARSRLAGADGLLSVHVDAATLGDRLVR